MIELSLIESDAPCMAWLDSLKTYASVADDSQDALLNSLLLRACLRVQEMADKSILSCRFLLSEDEAEGSVRLYQTVSEVVNVKDGEGNGVSWVRKGRKILVDHTTVEVEYTTKPNPMEVEALMPVVFQYATALYDGEDSGTLANILKQCL
jgi:hypothetical protein